MECWRTGCDVCVWGRRRRWVPIVMGLVMFALGIAIPLLVREPAKGRYTPANKARTQVL